MRAEPASPHSNTTVRARPLHREPLRIAEMTASRFLRTMASVSAFCIPSRTPRNGRGRRSRMAWIAMILTWRPGRPGRCGGPAPPPASAEAQGRWRDQPMTDFRATSHLPRLATGKLPVAPAPGSTCRGAELHPPDPRVHDSPGAGRTSSNRSRSASRASSSARKITSASASASRRRALALPALGPDPGQGRQGGLPHGGIGVADPQPEFRHRRLDPEVGEDQRRRLPESGRIAVGQGGAEGAVRLGGQGGQLEQGASRIGSPPLRLGRGGEDRSQVGLVAGQPVAEPRQVVAEGHLVEPALGTRTGSPGRRGSEGAGDPHRRSRPGPEPPRIPPAASNGCTPGGRSGSPPGSTHPPSRRAAPASRPPVASPARAGTGGPGRPRSARRPGPGPGSGGGGRSTARPRRRPGGAGRGGSPRGAGCRAGPRSPGPAIRRGAGSAGTRASPHRRSGSGPAAPAPCGASGGCVRSGHARLRLWDRPPRLAGRPILA